LKVIKLIGFALVRDLQQRLSAKKPQIGSTKYLKPLTTILLWSKEYVRIPLPVLFFAFFFKQPTRQVNKAFK
jgi:hypothetical protein